MVTKRTANVVHRVMPIMEEMQKTAFALMQFSLNENNESFNQALGNMRVRAQNIINAIDEYKEGF